MKNYNAVISKLREIARDSLRLELVGARRSKIWNLTCEINAIEKEIQEHKKGIAILEFNMSEVKPNDPEKEEKTKEYTDNIKEVTECMESLKKDVEEVTKQIKEQEDGIAKIESGETKVSADKLDAVTEELIDVLTKEAAKTAAVTE